MTRFKKDFLRLLKKLKNGENFAFSRYSDGEVFVMQGKKLVLATDHVIVDNVKHGFGYPEDDYKHFDPEENQDVQDKLLQAFSYEKKNYFVGVG